MTDSTTQPASKGPTHVAYHFRDLGDGKSFKTRLGAGWSHSKGNGINVRLDTFPLDGRITLFPATEDKE